MMIKSSSMRNWLFSLLILVSASLACSGVARFNEWSAEPGSVLFKDDFSTTAGGWTRLKTAGGQVGYDNGAFRVIVDQPEYHYWATPGLNFGDVRIEVDTGRYGGPVENRIGLICRYQNDANYYFFIISSDGFYAVGKVSNGQTINLGQEQMQSSPAIRTDIAINHLRADCVGNTLAFYVNDYPVALTTDDEFTRGDVGLLAGTFNEIGVDIVFDDFVVYKP